MTAFCAVVQARMSSSRLPGKVLAPLAGAPAIVRMLERLRAVDGLEWLVVATSVDPTDDPLAAACERHGFPVSRGSLEDVLHRTVEAVPADCDAVIRLTGDCPLIDPALVETHMGLYRENRPWVEYVSNAVVRTYPDGLDVEVIDAALLREAERQATSSRDREHVTPWVQRRARQLPVAQEPDLSLLRWTLDTADDYDNIAAIYSALHPSNPSFTTGDIYRLLIDQPSLLRVAGVEELTDDARDAWLARLKQVSSQP